MNFTQAAIDAILNVMSKKGLSPKTYYLEVNIMENNLGITFTTEKMGIVREYGELKVLYGNDQLMKKDVTVDYAIVNNKKGLIFLGT